MLHDLFDTAIPLQDLIGLGTGMIKSVGRLNVFYFGLEVRIEIKMFVVDKIVDGCIVAGFGKQPPDIMYGSCSQGLIVNKRPGRCLVKISGPLYTILFY